MSGSALPSGLHYDLIADAVHLSAKTIHSMYAGMHLEVASALSNKSTLESIRYVLGSLQRFYENNHTSSFYGALNSCLVMPYFQSLPSNNRITKTFSYDARTAGMRPFCAYPSTVLLLCNLQLHFFSEFLDLTYALSIYRNHVFHDKHFIHEHVATLGVSVYAFIYQSFFPKYYFLVYSRLVDCPPFTVRRANNDDSSEK